MGDDIIKTDEIKKVLGDRGKVSTKGFYAGLTAGRFGGGYLGFQAGESYFDEAEPLSVDFLGFYPQIDIGVFGPEEQMIYLGALGGYVAGAFGLAKAVTKYQEYKDEDVEYRRPFLFPFEGIKSVKKFLESDVDEPDDSNLEVIEGLIDEDEED